MLTARSQSGLDHMTEMIFIYEMIADRKSKM